MFHTRLQLAQCFNLSPVDPPHRVTLDLNSLVPGRAGCDFRNAIFNLIFHIGIFRSFFDNVFSWMPWHLTDKSTLIQVIAWCRQASAASRLTRAPDNMFIYYKVLISWWHHQMETFSTLLALCEGNPPLTVRFPSQRPVTKSFDVFFDLCLNKPLNQQSRRRWF